MKKNAHKKRNRNRFRQGESKNWPKYLMTVGAMGALLTTAPGAAFAKAPQEARIAPTVLAAIYGDDGEAQAQRTQRFDIPPGPLETVLATFQKLTELQVLVPDEKLRAIPSLGVSGVYTAEKALAQILSGTGVTYRFSGPKIVTLGLEGVASSVEVLGRITPSSPKYTEPLRDTPQTITIIPKTVIEEQGATTLRDVLRNVPGLTMTAGEGGTPAGDNLTLRGFSARNDIFIDGARDLGSQSRDPFNLEQVEVVKGPGSSFTGRGSAGGSINLVSKAPNINRFFAGTISGGSDATKRFTGDVNLPINDRMAFRLNLLAHDSGVAGRDVVENQRWGVAPSLMYGLGSRTRLTFSYFYLEQDNISDYGIPWVPADNNALRALRNQPAPVPRDTFYGFRDRDYEHLRSDLATVKIERDFNDSITLRNQLRFGYSSRDSIATPPRFTTDVNSTAINREMRSWMAEDRAVDNQTDMRARFSTGKVEHSLVTGLALTYENNQRQNRNAANSPTTLLNPNPDDVYPGVVTLVPGFSDLTGKSVALYAFDTVKLSKYVELNGGLRFDRFDVDGNSLSSTGIISPLKRLDEMVSWRGGLVVKPKEEGSIYVSYATSLNPSLEGLSYNAASTALDPEKTYNLEVGSKWDLVDDRLSVNAAIFNVNKTNARTTDPVTNVVTLNGDVRVRGIEFGASGGITRALRVFGAYTLLDAEIVESVNPLEVGRRLQNTPRNSFNVWTTYLLPHRITLGGGPRLVGRRFGNNTNSRQVDAYWLLDAMASFPVSKHLDLRVNLYNLTNDYYFDRLGGGHIVPGAGRSVLVSAGFRF
ncbi:MAG TPA: TonB-dependent siderophore receptor [Blastocatellia bacterium]|nr:TonB-dependent siderophore receptor [Blastocatellia bacterium]